MSEYHFMNLLIGTVILVERACFFFWPADTTAPPIELLVPFSNLRVCPQASWLAVRETDGFPPIKCERSFGRPNQWAVQMSH